jgi:N-acetylglucosamine kinase-like BadF-type ATPase
VLAQSPQAVVLPCALFGGIAPFIKPWLAESVQQRLVQRQGDANLGALLLIKNKVKQARGIEPDQLVDVFKATKSC